MAQPKKAKKQKSKGNSYSPRAAQQSQDEQMSELTASMEVEEPVDDDFAAAIEKLTGGLAARGNDMFADAREVRLKRNGGELGVTAHGGIESNKMPWVSPNLGAAIPLSGGGIDQEGEMLLKVNGKLVVGLLQNDLKAALDKAGDEVTLLLFHAKEVPTCQEFLKMANSDKAEFTQQVAGALRSAVQAYTTPYTSRPKREGEVDGREYNFVSKEEFEKMIKDDAFFEYSTHPQVCMCVWVWV
jgi:hypothetical protein